MGAVSLTLTLFAILLGTYKESNVTKLIGGCCRLPFALFSFSWLITGNILVFGQWPSVDLEDKESEHYCDNAAYMFSFVLLILAWVAAPIASIIICCLSAIGIEEGEPGLTDLGELKMA